MHEDRKERLAEFVAWSRAHITGDEKGEAQIFLDRLFQAFDLKGVREAGATLEMRVKKRDDGGTAFADLVYKPVVLIEMKKRGADLARHYRQAFDYWVRLAPNRPKYVILCNFDEFWIYDFDSAQLDEPLDRVPLAELPDRWGPLRFLYPTRERPTFGNDHEEVTRKAADLLAACFNKLIARQDVGRATAQRFILQMLVALFAEDIGLLDKYFVTELLEDCKSPADSFDLLGGLFVAMNTDGKSKGGRFKGVAYFNGGLFAEPARLELHADELNPLRAAAKSNWAKVRPEIFGTLFEHSLGHEERHAFGAHFTVPVDIMKIVGPTIVQPWRERLAAAKTREQLIKLRDRLQHFIVLDPACGSGNFLYVAYRELKRLESEIHERLQNGFHSKYDPAQKRFGFVTAQQFFGLDINPFAIELAKVTMMIARKLAIDELHITESPLPLDNLDSNFIACDALIDPAGRPTKWPQADVIIGNPPFLDARKMTMEHGREFVARLESLYPDVPRRADLCTYWLRKAQDHLPTCSKTDRVSGRAGLVGTQNIRNNQSRLGGLDYVVKTGTIVEAVDNQPWSGEANVHVSIVNWVNSQDDSVVPKTRKLWTKVEMPASKKRSTARKRGVVASKQYELACRECASINSALSDQTDVAQARVLVANRQPKRCFEGQQPGHDGFRLDVAERAMLLRSENAGKLIFPYLNGTDLLTERFASQPKFIVDFGTRTMLEAAEFPKTLDLIRKRVLADWEANAQAELKGTGKTTGEHQGRLETWWQLKRRRSELLKSISSLPRYIACSRVTKRPIFAFVSARIRPDSSLTCFALADDYSFGILQSNAHWHWFVTKCSKLKSDFRYTPDTVFDTFPVSSQTLARLFIAWCV
jgi:N-6 DNA Methylase